MHIMHVIDSLDIGGAERAAVDLANATVKSGHRVSFCTTRHAGVLASELSPSIAVYHLNRTRRFDWPAMRRFRHIVRSTHVDIIHAHMRSTAAFVTFLKAIGWLEALVLLQDHHGGIEIDSSTPKWLSWWGNCMIDKYVGVYPKLCQWAKEAGFPDGKIGYVGYGLDLSRLDSAQAIDVHGEFDLPTERVVGIVVGNIRLEKGTDLLIELIADSLIAKEAIYLFVGRDADPEFAQMCRNLVTEYHLQHCIRFVGSRRDVPSLLRGVDFAIIPSRSESGPLVLIEYLAAGLPVVSFNVGDLSAQIAQKGVSGFALLGDVVTLRQELEELLKLSPDERAQRGAAGRRIIEESFSIEAKLPEWLQIYQRLLLRSAP